MAPTPPASSSSKPNAPPVVVPPSGNNIIINPLQRGNPVLERIKNVGKEFGDIIVDYQVGKTTGVLWLSLKYHRLHPEYIHTRIEKLGSSYNLRILLILCDVSEHRDPIRELTRICLLNDVTIVLAFSLEEAGHYITTYKQFEHKPPTMIKERVEKDYPSMLRTALTSISKINTTDATTLRGAFGSVAGISNATSDQLQILPGFGHVKVKNIKNAFEKPFRHNATSTLTSFQRQAAPLTEVQTQEANPAPAIVPVARPVVEPTRKQPLPRASVSGHSASARTASSSRLAAIQAALDQPPPSVPTSNSRPPPPAPRAPPRSPSPEWDIELDLDLPDETNNPGPRRPPTPPANRHGADEMNLPPGEFDIDLDL